MPANAADSLVLGTGRFGDALHSIDECEAVLRASYEAGIRTVIVDMRTWGGIALDLVAKEARAGRAWQIWLTGAPPPPELDQDEVALHVHFRRQLAAAETSLEGGHVAMYLLQPPSELGLPGTLRAISELVALGLVANYGVASFWSHTFARLVWLCEERGIQLPCVSTFPRNLLVALPEHDALVTAYEIRGVACQVLAGGLLSGRTIRPNGVPSESPRVLDSASSRLQERVHQAQQLFASVGATNAAACYAAVLGLPEYDAAVIAPSCIDDVDDAIAALSLVESEPFVDALKALGLVDGSLWHDVANAYRGH